MPSFHRICAAAALPLLLGSAAWAQAPSCGLRRLASLQMTPVPGRTAMTVPVAINGTDKNFLVATGGGATTLTETAGQSLSLRPHFDMNLRFLDTEGYAGSNYFLLENVGVGNMQAQDMMFIMTPDPNFGKSPPLDGTLSADLMMSYDMEIDFAQRRLNFFSPDHCAGNVVYWPATVVGEAPIALVKRSDDAAHARNAMHHGGIGDVMNHLERTDAAPLMTTPLQGVDIRTSVILDGKTFPAIIDTGSEVSTLNAATAKVSYDVTAEPDGGSQHTFHTLTFGGVTVANPRFEVRPDKTGIHDPDNGHETGSRLARVDDFPRANVTIGMNVLSKLHLYFAFKEGKLYVTQEDGSTAMR